MKRNAIKNIIIPLLTMIILMAVMSCGQKSWKNRGVKKGWIIETAVHDTIYLAADTILVDSTAEVFVTMLDTLLQDTCINKANRAKIKYIIKKEFIPAALQTYKDTAVVGKDGNKYFIKFTPAGIEITAYTPKQTIQPLQQTKWQKFWTEFKDMILYLLIALLVLAVIFRFGK